MSSQRISTFPLHLLSRQSFGSSFLQRAFSTSSIHRRTDYRDAPGTPTEGEFGAKKAASSNKLPHLTKAGTAHMVDIGEKRDTKRVAVASCQVAFQNREVVRMIQSNALKKGDVLAVARIAGIMAAKKTSDIIPLCHPIRITHVEVDISLTQPNLKYNGNARITAVVETVGQTGVEMEALTACSAAALTVFDMVKKVDLGARIIDLRVDEKSGGQRGHWVRDDSEGKKAHGKG